MVDYAEIKIELKALRNAAPGLIAELKELRGITEQQKSCFVEIEEAEG